MFSVMGPCNLNGQHRVRILDLTLQSFDGLCKNTQNVPQIHSISYTYETIGCPDSNHIINLHHCEHLKPYTKVMKN